MRNVHDSDYERITTAGMDTNKRRRRYLLLVVLCVLAFDMEPFWLLTAIVLLLPTIEEVEQEIEEEIQHEAMPASPIARRSKARMIEEHRVIRSRDMIRSHLDEDWH